MMHLIYEAPFTIVLTSTMGDITYAENEDMHCMYGRGNGNGRAQLRMHHAQFSDRRMPDHRIFQRLQRQLHETRSFHVTRHDAGRRRHVRSSNLDESILNVVANRPESSTKVVAHHVSVSHQSVCRVLNENLSHLFHFQRVQALNQTDYILGLQVGGTVTCATVGLHRSCVEQLLLTLHLSATLSIKQLIFSFVSYFFVFVPHRVTYTHTFLYNKR
ncbi:DUF4817 domain-containing protein [Trichonephila clavipes]|uniref:DUF4817 domain-containing protein n=1 Tax=Trichonephila clavipes TaxID=2585209 RepID=A0A8X6UX80_TRICX|nr:DUF4817 domain-containing protein [Trichonephila clavipes]